MSKEKSKSNIILIILLVILIIAVIVFGIYFVMIYERNTNQTNTQTNTTNNSQNIEDKHNDDSTSKNGEETIENPTEPVETKDQYVSRCDSYTFKEIARNPNNYIGKRAEFTGEVIQVQEEDDIVAIRVNITKDQYGYYDDTIMVAYQYKDINESKILEDDIITVYGELQGNISYESVLGAQITLPLLMASYIDIK